MATTDYRVAKLASHDGERILAAHVYTPANNMPMWINEPGNRSLCGRSYIDMDGDEHPSEWDQIKDSPDFHTNLADVTCKSCAKLAKKLLS